MTRINVIPVEELSDQWLIAEYRELPRVIKQDISTSDAPQRYKLGAGHVKWAKYYSWFLLKRYFSLCEEMKYRGFKVDFPFLPLAEVQNHNDPVGALMIDYQVTDEDIQLNRQRLIEKYKLKPNYYKWTNRVKPQWLEDLTNETLCKLTI